MIYFKSMLLAYNNKLNFSEMNKCDEHQIHHKNNLNKFSYQNNFLSVDLGL